MAHPDKRIEDVVAYSILLSERIRSAADNHAKSFRFECAHLSNLVHRLWLMLHSLARFTAPKPSLYERPISRVLSERSKNLDQALALARKCRRRGVFCRLFTTTSVAADDFRQVFRLLEASIADLMWLLRVYGVVEGGIDRKSVPPIAASNPILSPIWSLLIHTTRTSERCAYAANKLAALADVSDGNKELIVKEGGVPLLLTLLKESIDPEARSAAAAALHSLANDQKRVRVIHNSDGSLPIIVKALTDGSAKIRDPAAMLVARMAEHGPEIREDFARENIARHLVKNLLSSSQQSHAPAKAIWMLTRGSTANCRRITQSKNALLCLAKMLEEKTAELQYCSLMAIKEVTAAAEANADLRQKVLFKANAFPVMDQLLRLVDNDGGRDLKIPAIRSIGSLSMSFPAREERIIVSLMRQLAADDDVATEAAISLAKYVCCKNYLRSDHSKKIIELNGVDVVVTRFLSPPAADQTTRFSGLVLLCYLALHAAPAMEGPGRGRVLTELQAAHRSVAAAHCSVAAAHCSVAAAHCYPPYLMELLLKAICHLKTFPLNKHFDFLHN